MLNLSVNTPHPDPLPMGEGGAKRRVRGESTRKKKGQYMFFLLRKVYKVCSHSRILALLVVTGALMLVASCTVGPNYVKPQAETPDAYKETQGWKKAQPGDDVIKGKWWEIFNDP